MEELRWVLMVNNLKNPAYRADEVSSEVRAIRQEAMSRGGLKGKQVLSYYDEIPNPIHARD